MNETIRLPGEAADLDVVMRPLIFSDVEKLVELKLAAIAAGEGLMEFSKADLMRGRHQWPEAYHAQMLFGAEMGAEERALRALRRRSPQTLLGVEKLVPGWGWAVEDDGILLAFAYVREVSLETDVLTPDRDEAEVLMRRFPWQLQDFYFHPVLQEKSRKVLLGAMMRTILASLMPARIGLFMFIRNGWMRNWLNRLGPDGVVDEAPHARQLSIVQLLPEQMAYFWRDDLVRRPDMTADEVTARRQRFNDLWPVKEAGNASYNADWAKGFWDGRPEYVQRMLSASGG